MRLKSKSSKIREFSKIYVFSKLSFEKLFENDLIDSDFEKLWFVRKFSDCILSLIDFFKSILFSSKKISKTLFFRKFSFINLSTSSRKNVRKKNSNITFFNTRDRFHDRIFIRKFVLKIANSTAEKFLENSLITHVFIMTERMRKVEKIMQTNWTKIHENQFKFHINMKIFFNRFVDHNLEINISMIFKFRVDRNKFFVRIINLKKKTEKNLFCVNRRVEILKIEIFKTRNFFDLFQIFVFVRTCSHRVYIVRYCYET